MKYVTLFLPFLVSGALVDPSEAFNCEAQNELMFRKLKCFENNGAPLPHNANLNGEIQKDKRDSFDTSSIQVEEPDIEQEFFDPKKFEKASPVLEICKKDEYLIGSAEDLRRLQLQCEDVTGDIRFVDFGDAVVDFGKLESIGGSLFIENISNIVKIQGSRLNKIGGSFSLKSLTSLVSLDMPSLRELRELEWKVVPILNTAFLNDQVSGLKKITISDSSLPAIEEFNKVLQLDILDINNNRFLERIKVNVETVTEKLSISANAKQLELEMPKLTSAQNITIRDTSLVHIPLLETVGSSLELIENDCTAIELPNLKSIGGSLGVIDNRHLTLIDFGNVTEIQGGLIIANNSMMQRIDSFGSLKQIGGGVYFEGNFSDTNFPQLKLVKGSAYVKTDSEKLDCSKWTTPANGRSIIRGGKINCISAKTEESESVDNDGMVLNKTENKIKKGSESGEGRQALFSEISSSNSDTHRSPNMTLTLSLIVAALLICQFF